MILVAKFLARTYRPVVLWFLCAVAVIVAAVSIVAARVSDTGFSFWLITSGHATKWWLLIMGILLVATYLKLYVANGVTRHDFLLGSALFGGLTATAFAVLLPIGHGIEQLVWMIIDTPPPATRRSRPPRRSASSATTCPSNSASWSPGRSSAPPSTGSPGGPGCC